MRLNAMAMAVAASLLWGGAILLVTAANLAWPGYGQAFLELAASIYPGYAPGSGIGSIITGTLYGLADGAIAGAIFAWLYNLVARKFSAPAA
jgi:hypothetical protein